jgi:hypothetical protein
MHNGLNPDNVSLRHAVNYERYMAHMMEMDVHAVAMGISMGMGDKKQGKQVQKKIDREKRKRKER